MDNNRVLLMNILDEYIKNMNQVQKDAIEAIVLIGSLSTKNFIYTTGCDIDIVTILKDHIRIEDYEMKSSYIEQDFKNEKNIQIDNTIYNKSDLMQPFETDFENIKLRINLANTVVELLRIKESGIVVYGNKTIISELSTPTRKEILSFYELSEELGKFILDSNDNYADQRSKMLEEMPPNIATQILFTNAFKHYYIKTSKSCSDKLEIYKKVEESIPDYKFLKGLELATKYRQDQENGLDKNEINALRQEAKEFMSWKKKTIEDLPLI